MHVAGASGAGSSRVGVRADGVVLLRRTTQLPPRKHSWAREAALAVRRTAFVLRASATAELHARHGRSESGPPLAHPHAQPDPRSCIGPRLLCATVAQALAHVGAGWMATAGTHYAREYGRRSHARGRWVELSSPRRRQALAPARKYSGARQLCRNPLTPRLQLLFPTRSTHLGHCNLDASPRPSLPLLPTTEVAVGRPSRAASGWLGAQRCATWARQEKIGQGSHGHVYLATEMQLCGSADAHACTACACAAGGFGWGVAGVRPMAVKRVVA